MKKKFKMILGAMLFCVMTVSILIWLVRPDRRELYTVEAAALTDTLWEQATVVAKTDQVMTAPLSGVVAQVPKLGEVIESGQVAVSVDDKKVREEIEDQIEALKLKQTAVVSEQGIRKQQLITQLEQSKLQYEKLYTSGQAAVRHKSAQASYEKAKKDFENGKTLKESGFLSDQDLSLLELQFLSAGQELTAAQSDNSSTAKSYYEGLIKSAEVQLRLMEEGKNGGVAAEDAASQELQVTIDSLEKKLSEADTSFSYPVIVKEILVSQGDYVMENQPLVRIYQEGDLQVEAWLLAEETRGIEPGMGIECQLFDGRTFTGEVTFLSLVAKDMVSSIGLSEARCQLILSTQDMPQDIGAGFPVEITCRRILSPEALKIPVTCLVPMKDGQGVRVASGRNSKLIMVETGQKGDGYVEVISGLKEGDQVIVNP